MEVSMGRGRRIVRISGAGVHMKKSINAWTIPDGASFEEMFESIARAGFEAIELNIDSRDASAHSLFLDTTEREYARIRKLSVQWSLPVCSISTSLYGGNLGSADAAEREYGKKLLAKQIECAQALGAGAILCVPGGMGPETSMAVAWAQARRTLEEMLPAAETSGIVVGLENVWNGFFASPYDMARFVDSFGSACIRAYFDVGNVLVNAKAEDWIEILDRRICRVHVKDFLRTGANQGAFVNLLQGDARWDRIMKALVHAGYDGCLTAELSTIPAHPAYLYRITSLALDEILKLA